MDRKLLLTKPLESATIDIIQIRCSECQHINALVLHCICLHCDLSCVVPVLNKCHIPWCFFLLYRWTVIANAVLIAQLPIGLWNIEFIIFSQKHRIKSKKVKPANQRNQEITSIKYLLAFIFDHKLGKYCVKRRLFYWPASTKGYFPQRKTNDFCSKAEFKFFSFIRLITRCYRKQI